MDRLGMDEIVYRDQLFGYYIGTIVSAQAAFFFMAFREWKPDDGKNTSSKA
jgi:hypothetical protein